MSMHIFGRNQYGTACIRCGYFTHTKEASQHCSGKFDGKIIADAEESIRQYQQKIDMIRKYSYVKSTTPSSDQEQEGHGA